jgi:hypothetical protein
MSSFLHHLRDTSKMVDYILTLYENYTLKQSVTKRNQLVTKTRDSLSQVG